MLWEDLNATSSTHSTRSERQMQPKRKQENDRTWILFRKCPFWACIKKNPAHSLFSAWSFFLVHIRFTPSEGPKAFKSIYLRSLSMEVGPRTRTIQKGHLPWTNLPIFVRVCMRVLHFHELEALGELAGSLSFALWIVTKSLW